MLLGFGWPAVRQKEGIDYGYCPFTSEDLALVVVV
jgi:hypothetical protein